MESEQDNDNNEAMSKFWAYVKAKIKAAQEWANKVIVGLKGSSKGDHTHKHNETFVQGDDSS